MLPAYPCIRTTAERRLEYILIQLSVFLKSLTEFPSLPMLKEMIFHLSPTYHLAYQTSPSETLLASELGYKRFTASNLAGSSNKVRRDEGLLELEAAELDIVV